MLSLAAALLYATATVLGSAIPLEARSPVNPQCPKINGGIAKQPAQQQALYAPFCSSYLSPFSTTATVRATSTASFVVTVSSVDSKTVTTTTTSLTTGTVKPTPVTLVETAVTTITSLSYSTSTSIRIYKRASRTKQLPVATPTGLSGASPQQISLTCSCQGVSPPTVTALKTSTVLESFTSTSSRKSTTTATATATTIATVLTTLPTITDTRTVLSSTTTTVQATTTRAISARAHLQADSMSGSVSNLYAYFAFEGCRTTPNCIKFKSTRDTDFGRFYVPNPPINYLVAQAIGGLGFYGNPGGSTLSLAAPNKLYCQIPNSDNLRLDGSQNLILDNNGLGNSYSSARFAVCNGELWVISPAASASCPSGPFEYVNISFVPIL